MSRKMSAEEKRWQAESDAHILKRHAELHQNPQRVKAAKDQISKELQALQTAAGIAPKQQPIKQTTAAKTSPKSQPAKSQKTTTNAKTSTRRK